MGYGQAGTKQTQHKPANPLLIQLENKTYRLAKPMEIVKLGMVLDGHGATLVGTGTGVGLHVGAVGNVTIKNVKIVGFATGLLAEGSSSLTISNVTILGSESGNTANEATGIRLEKVSASSLQGIQVHGCNKGSVITG